MTRESGFIGWSGVVAAFAAAGALAVGVATGASSSGALGVPVSHTDETPTGVENRYLACMDNVSGSPDVLGQWTDACQRLAQLAEERYLACMRNVGGSADTLEHWSAACEAAARPSDRVRLLPCPDTTHGSADTVERWRDEC